MGVGKSTVGRALAEGLSLPFVDSDELLADRYGPIEAQIRENEALFRQREAALIRELCDGVTRVLATGGGVFADAALRRALRSRYRLVTLQAPLPVLVGRLGDGAGRPLWGADVAGLFERRAAAYRDVDRVVDVAGATVEQVTEEVVAWLRR